MSLSKTSISAAYGLAQQVTRKGLILGAVTDSALADSLEACDTDHRHIQVIDGDEAVETFESPEAQLVHETSYNATDDCQNDHSDCIDHLTDLGARAVSFTMDVARNEVTPKVKSVVAMTENHIDALRSKRMEPLVIEPKFLAPIYDSADLGDMLSKYDNAPHRDITPLRLNGAWGTDASIVGPIMTGSAGVDADLVRHFEGREEQVKDLWERYFGNVAGKYRSADHRADLKDADDALVVFLGSNALLSGDVPEGTRYSLADYRAYLADLKEQSGSHLNYLLKRARTANKAKSLVISAPSQTAPGQPITGTIQVNGPVYNEWLAAGGSPEALYGAVSQGASLNYGSVLSDAASHVGAWQRQLNVLKAQAAFELRAATIQGLKQALLTVAAELRDAGKLNADPTAFYDTLNVRLANLASTDLENLYEIAQNEVCDLFYGHTDAKDFLRAMNAAANANSGMDIREVALLVAIDYVTGWVASSIVVAKGE